MVPAVGHHIEGRCAQACASVRVGIGTTHAPQNFHLNGAGRSREVLQRHHSHLGVSPTLAGNDRQFARLSRPPPRQGFDGPHADQKVPEPNPHKFGQGMATLKRCRKKPRPEDLLRSRSTDPKTGFSYTYATQRQRSVPQQVPRRVARAMTRLFARQGALVLQQTLPTTRSGQRNAGSPVTHSPRGGASHPTRQSQSLHESLKCPAQQPATQSLPQ